MCVKKKTEWQDLPKDTFPQLLVPSSSSSITAILAFSPGYAHFGISQFTSTHDMNTLASPKKQDRQSSSQWPSPISTSRRRHQGSSSNSTRHLSHTQRSHKTTTWRTSWDRLRMPIHQEDTTTYHRAGGDRRLLLQRGGPRQEDHPKEGTPPQPMITTPSSRPKE